MSELKKYNILFSGWIMPAAHSYSCVNCFQLLSLYENYKDRINFYIDERPYYNPTWPRKLVYGSKNEIITNEEIFKKYNPEYPFEYKFVDEEYARKFDNEKRQGTLASLFAGLTIFISCLGLFGLATYMAENRIKEIGVRKVLGASVTKITTLLSKDFIILVLIAFIIAVPLAYLGVSKWLQNFEYRVTIQWWVFAIACFLSVAIALLTVSFQAIKAAIANPVKSLRTE